MRLPGFAAFEVISLTQEPMPFTNTQKRACAWCLIAALVVLGLWQLGPVLTPFVVAALSLVLLIVPIVGVRRLKQEYMASELYKG